MVKINLRDKNFDGDPCATWGQQNINIEWVRENALVSTSCFFTDICLPDVLKATKAIKRKVAWILEPKAIHPMVYEWISQNNKLFDYVLTFDMDLVNRGENFLYYPHGRCWIKNYNNKEKTKICSNITSTKNTTTGHRLRHEIIKALPGMFDNYGYGYKPVKLKEEALDDYMFSITIENSKQDDYWTEKIVDCFATKTVPLFWGHESVTKTFNKDGILFFDTIEDLKKILNSLSKEKYLSMKKAIDENFETHKKFIIPEEWMLVNYPFLFK